MASRVAPVAQQVVLWVRRRAGRSDEAAGRNRPYASRASHGIRTLYGATRRHALREPVSAEAIRLATCAAQ